MTSNWATGNVIAQHVVLVCVHGLLNHSMVTSLRSFYTSVADATTTSILVDILLYTVLQYVDVLILEVINWPSCMNDCNPTS